MQINLVLDNSISFNHAFSSIITQLNVVWNTYYYQEQYNCVVCIS